MGQTITDIATKHYQNQELKKARKLIDSAITIEKHKKDPYTWQLRGYIYKELFKNSEEPQRSEHREKGISSFKKALNKGAEGRIKNASRKGLIYLGQSCYNDAMKRLDTSSTKGPIQLYERYISVMKRIGKDSSALKKDMIGFYNSLGVVYMSIYESEREHDQETFDRAIETFGKVLDMDSSNYLANYNSGIMYYNRGVQIAQKIDPSNMSVQLKKVKKLQKKSTKKFKDALPYMKEAHEQRPKRLETLEGLSGIYYSLNEEKKSQHYKDLKKKIIKQRKR
ncbi:MAG: tetratricopeptide repeat protein [Flavobacteriales bacterium]